MMPFINHFLDFFIESAPWLLLGLAVAGAIKAFIPEDYLSRHLGGKGLKTTIKAAFIGAPLPLCSCGVVPAALGIRRAGASKNATVSFLVATPETGIDSLFVTYALMGPWMAIMRPIAAIVSAISAGILVGKSEQHANDPAPATPPSCCKKSAATSVPPATLKGKLIQGFRFSFIDMLDDIIVWLLIGLLFAALVQTFVPESFLASFGDSFLAFVIMAVIGVPMYVCATASTPIAAGLLAAGVSPGAVLVFMLVGPATNIGTLAIVKNELGKRPLIAYLIGIVVCAFGFGILTNYLFNLLRIVPANEMGHHAMQHQGIYTAFAVVLGFFCLLSLGKKIKKHFA